MALIPTIERVTPNTAKRWLETNEENRRLSRAFVDFLRGQMRDGSWKANAETIKLNGQDHLIDGQHRLTAMVEEGRSLDLLVVRGVSKDAFDTIDQGKPRNLADTLYRHGEESPATLASAVRLYAVLSGQQSLNRKMPNPRGVRILDEHPKLRKAIEFAKENDARLVLPLAWAAAVYYRSAEKHPRKAAAFWGPVFSGADLHRGTNPMRLHQALIKDKQSKEKMPRRLRLQLLCKSWAIECENESTERLRIAARDPITIDVNTEDEEE